MANLRRLLIAIVVLLCACMSRSSGDAATTVITAIAAEADELKAAGESRACSLDPVESDLDDDDDETTGHDCFVWVAFDDIATVTSTPSRAWVREHEVDPTRFDLSVGLARGPPV